MNMIGRIYAALLGIALLCTPACQVNELLATDNEVQQLSAEAETQALIEKARSGDTESYHTLAIRHRDGIGTDPDHLSAFIYQGIYCTKTDDESSATLNIFEEGSPSHALIEMLSITDNDIILQKLNELTNIPPVEAAAIRTIIAMDNAGDSSEAITRLEELEKEGSIFAVLSQLMYFEETRDADRYEALLQRMSERHPFYHQLLAEFYERKYNGIECLHWIEKAKEHYQTADSYALLTPRFARHYYQMLEHFDKENLIPCSQEEIDRIKRLAKRHIPSYKADEGTE